MSGMFQLNCDPSTSRRVGISCRIEANQTQCTAIGRMEENETLREQVGTQTLQLLRIIGFSAVSQMYTGRCLVYFNGGAGKVCGTALQLQEENTLEERASFYSGCTSMQCVITGEYIFSQV